MEAKMSVGLDTSMSIGLSGQPWAPTPSPTLKLATPMLDGLPVPGADAPPPEWSNPLSSQPPGMVLSGLSAGLTPTTTTRMSPFFGPLASPGVSGDIAANVPAANTPSSSLMELFSVKEYPFTSTPAPPPPLASPPPQPARGQPSQNAQQQQAQGQPQQSQPEQQQPQQQAQQQQQQQQQQAQQQQEERQQTGAPSPSSQAAPASASGSKQAVADPAPPPVHAAAPRRGLAAMSGPLSTVAAAAPAPVTVPSMPPASSAAMPPLSSLPLPTHNAPSAAAPPYHARVAAGTAPAPPPQPQQRRRQQQKQQQHGAQDLYDAHAAAAAAAPPPPPPAALYDLGGATVQQVGALSVPDVPARKASVTPPPAGGDGDGDGDGDGGAASAGDQAGDGEDGSSGDGGQGAARGGSSHRSVLGSGIMSSAVQEAQELARRKAETYAQDRKRRRRTQTEEVKVERPTGEEANLTADERKKKRYKRRLELNRESAAVSRVRRREYVKLLEEQLVTAERERVNLASQLSRMKTDHDRLRDQLQNLEDGINQSGNN